jgi:CelD/BcsL family acetyltransferase involved in cellulose biosynthesis
MGEPAAACIAGLRWQRDAAMSGWARAGSAAATSGHDRWRMMVGDCMFRRIRTPGIGEGDVRVDVITDDAGIAQLGPDWDRLAQELGRPLASPAWLTAWWRHLAPAGAVPRIIACRRGPDLIAVLPLFGRQRGGLWRYATFGDATAASDVWLAAAGAGPEVSWARGPALRRLRPGPASLTLFGQEAGVEASDELARRWPAVRSERASQQAPSLTTHPDGFEAWMAAKSRNFRKSMGQSRRRLEREGARVVRTTDPVSGGRALAAFHRLHSARWGPRSPLSSERALAALRDTAAALGDRGRLWAWTLFDPADEVAAVELVMCAGGTHLFWSGGWDEAWMRFSPSMVLLLAAVEDAHAQGARTVDLGPGDQRWKHRFADRERTLVDVALLPLGWRGTLAGGSSLVGAGLRRARSVVASGVRRG